MHFVYGWPHGISMVFWSVCFRVRPGSPFQSSIALTKLIPWAGLFCVGAPLLELEYCTRPLDVLHRSWTILMLEKNNSSTSLRCDTYPWATSLLIIVPTKHGRLPLLQFLMLLLLQTSSRLCRMKVTSLKTYPYTQSASTERSSVEAPWPL